MKTQNLKNENGFGVVGFLALLPLLMAILAFISGVVLVMKTNARLTHECRTELLQAQRSISNQLNQIVALNKTATALRAARKVAEAYVIATLAIPPAHPAAIAARDAVKVQQMLLKNYQRSLIVIAKGRTLAAPKATSFFIGKSLNEEVRAVSNKFALPRSKTNSPSFNVKASPENDDSPDYNPVENFTPQQEMKVSLEFDLASVLPAWLKKFLPAEGLRLKTQCSATIEKENSKWIEKLSAAR